MFRILDVDPDHDAPSLDQTLARVHPADRERLEGALKQAQLGQPAVSIRYRIMTQQATVRFLEAVMAGKASSNGSTVLIGWLRDFTETHHAEREIAIHIAVSEALRQWESFDQDAERLIGELALAFGFIRAALWIPAGGGLVARIIWPSHDQEQLRRETAEMRLSPDEGLAGIAWRRKTPVTLSSALEEPGYRFRDAAAREGLRGAVAVPIVASEQVLGVISLAGREALELTDRLHATLSGVGHELGVFLEHRTAEWMDQGLSAREVQILQLASKGLSGPAIARRLGISPATVKTHFEHIYAKYGVPDRVAAVAKAVRAGLIR
jgi:DNA-binding CsgD family transcriptional regulator